MRLLSTPLRATALLAVALVLASCGSPTAPGSGGDAVPSASSASAPPAAVPAAADPVTGVGTVIETLGASPEVCLGPVRESFPPQCDGIPLVGWSWAEHPPEQTADLDGPSTSWGQYAVTGTFDGVTLTVTGAVPLALYDTVADPSPRPVAPPDLTADQWAAVESGVRLLPGMLTSTREGETGPVHVDVVHDDGTLQDWADATFGPGAVRVTSMLRSR